MHDHPTNADAIIDLASRQQRLGHAVGEPAGRIAVTKRNDEAIVLLDDETTLATPRRSHGTIQVTDADSFVAAVTQRQLPGIKPTVYLNEAAFALVAVLNDDHGDTPGWRDNRIELILQETPEWKRWMGVNRRWLTQEEFASLIEDSAKDFVSPDAATMLELAQHFHATTSARFQSGANLRTGARTIGYTEEVEASAGREGALTIPETFELGLRPFYGAVNRKQDDPTIWEDSRFKVLVNFKFRLREAKLELGAWLDEPDERRRHAWRLMAERIGEGLELKALAGPAPAPRTAAPLSTCLAD